MPCTHQGMGWAAAVVVCLITACSETPSSQVHKTNREFTSLVSSSGNIIATPPGSAVFDQALYDAAPYADGGRIYDKWWTGSTVTPPPAAPTGNHPLWPGTSTGKSGDTTWRCKSCHGWDYRGANGVYGSRESSYYTGIKGIINWDQSNPAAAPMFTTPEDVFLFIHDGTVNGRSHAFGDQLDDADVYALAKFVISVQEEANAGQAPHDFIEDGSGRVLLGSVTNGQSVYELAPDAGGCGTVDCHEANGRLLDFEDGDPATQPNTFVDTYARTNPWEALHKNRFGQPASTMPGFEDYADPTLNIQAAVDVMAYSQNGLIPSANGFDFQRYANPSLVTQDLASGGLLYDKWWLVRDSGDTTPPAGDHPLWAATGNTLVAGADTWRCKECHGWDYRGVDGVYGYPQLGDPTTGTHYTGQRGVINLAALNISFESPQEIFDFLHSGTAPTAIPDHAFSADLSNNDLYALTRFLETVQNEANGGEAPHDFIDEPGTSANGAGYAVVSGGDAAAGMMLYNMVADEATGAPVCGDAAGGCHGIDGTAIDFHAGTGEPPEYVHHYAQGNPWETLHKNRFGHPGSEMPGMVQYENPELGLQAAVDITRYSQAGLLRDYVRGGRLYDDWVAETGMDPAMLSTNPLWDWGGPPATVSAAESWMCSTCHGWDYTGWFEFGNDLVWLKDIRGFTPHEVFGYLSGGTRFFDGTGMVDVHAFAEHLNDQALWDLAQFAVDGIVDTYQYIRMTGQIRNADHINGGEIYHGTSPLMLMFNDAPFNCMMCHGMDGQGGGNPDNPTVDVFASSWQMPWRFFHKVRYGAPGTAMPGLLETMPMEPGHAVELHDAADVMDYVQDQGAAALP